ncbi:TonB family protein [Hanstruepera flava]|uniref:TonB family protein n=1 Tax=Hanstruepera flava TaxID=2930218 RepID=UPI002028091F|nr:TonB family protein [Hanstruepera flava]
MNLTDKHKSLLITGLLSGSLVMGLFTFHLKQQNPYLSESYYEVEPKTEEELKQEELEKTKAEEQAKAETNKAFNETENYKRFAKAYQPIAPPKDYEYTPSESQSELHDGQDKATTSQPEIDDDVLSSFNSVNSVLKKQQSNLSQQSVNKKSSMHYSLVNRTHRYLPTPIYLCETGGKIVVNITVNSAGKVTNASVNQAASVDNQCLKDHALEYANEARFNQDASKKSQLGSITFYFEGKN